MRNEKLEEAKKYLVNSNIANFVSEDEINKAVDNSYICDSKDELYQLYESKTGIEYDGALKGFNNGSKNYFPPDFTTHAAIHETLHTLSSTFNEEGKRLVNGIEVKDSAFGRFVNEGITEYLTTKICNEPPEAYLVEVSFFKNIDDNFSKYFESNIALEDMYINNRTDMLKEFVNSSLNKEDINFDDICNNFLFYNQEKMCSITSKINKGCKKILKRREFDKKHPILSKIRNKISRKDANLMLNAPKGNYENFKDEVSKNKMADDLKSGVYSTEEVNYNSRMRRENSRGIDEIHEDVVEK